MRVLIVEDDQETADYICSSLRELGHVFEHAADGKSGFLSALDSDFDVMVIDRMLPGLDGLSLVKSIRGADVATPILFLSAMGGINDRVDGLEAGADDYLVKPFAFSELSARLAALALLEYLMRNVERVVTRTMLLEGVWEFHFDPKTNVVETHISRLRNKIDRPFDRPLIHTVRGSGYSMHA